MYQTGDRVIYGAHGVCVMTGVEEHWEATKTRQYMVLEPIDQPGSRSLVPMDNPVAMGKVNRVLSPEELEKLLEGPFLRHDCWISAENLRKQAYREMIGSGDRRRLIGMIHTLYKHKHTCMEAGRKIHLCDSNFLRDAEKVLASEISAVMGMEPAEAREYLREKLK